MIDNDDKVFTTVSRSEYFHYFDFRFIDNPKYALDLSDADFPDVIVTEIKFSQGFDGIELVKKYKSSHPQVPVIVLSEKTDPFVVVLALEVGADDFVRKPFDTRELIARIKNALKHSYPENGRNSDAGIHKPNILNYPGLMIDKDSYIVTVNGNHVEMPPKEFELLYHLASNPNVIFTREQLLRQVWGVEYFGVSRTVDVHIKRLRDKVRDASDLWSIQTMWGKGYKFVWKNGISAPGDDNRQ